MRVLMREKQHFICALEQDFISQQRFYVPTKILYKPTTSFKSSLSTVASSGSLPSLPRGSVDAPTHLAQARSAEAAWQGSQAEEEDSYLLVGMA
jgi:hypothetical protein